MNKKIFILIVAFFSVTSLCKALPPPPPPPGGGDVPGCWPPPCIPIDGGISLLIAAGAIYGGRKLYKKKTEKKLL